MYADGRRTSTRQLCLSHRAAGVLTVLPVGLQYHLQISRSPVPKLPSLRVEPRQRRRVGDDSELRKQFSQPRLPRPCCHKFATPRFISLLRRSPFRVVGTGAGICQFGSFQQSKSQPCIRHGERAQLLPVPCGVVRWSRWPS